MTSLEAVGIDELVPAYLTAMPELAPNPTAGVAGAPRLVVLDDDPTGSQTVSDVPVLTRWAFDDIRWALAQGGSGFFILTNTRSLGPVEAAERIRTIAAAVRSVAHEVGVPVAFASRGDSTLRGHFPLETDVLIEDASAAGHPVDAVVLIPAYLDAGRLTVDGVHWVVRDGVGVPVAQTEFAQDESFGFTESDLALWAEQKSGGRIAAASVTRIGLDMIRRGGVDAVADAISEVIAGGLVVVDAVRDDDLRVVAAASARVESNGGHLIYRVGPSFVRARLGQTVSPPLGAEALRAGTTGSARHGLVVAGSHVSLTTRQIDRLRATQPVLEFELDVDRCDDLGALDSLARAIAAGLDESTVVLRTARVLRAGQNAEESLEIARAVSAAVVHVVSAVLDRAQPAFLVAKGGITSSDLATEALGIHRAWVAGTLLPGIVSLWRAVDGRLPGLPYIVFAGNVGDDDALARVVERLAAAFSSEVSV